MFRVSFVQVLTLAAFTFGSVVPVAAQEATDAPAKKEQGGGDLATAATNPVGSLIQLQLQDLYFPESDNSSGYANTAVVQPIFPFDLGKDSYFEGVVTRTTIPFVTTPKVNGERNTGTGDITTLAIPTHTVQGSKEGEFFTWGPIGAVTFPTASDPGTGTDVWSLGPGLLGLTNINLDGGDNVLLGGFGYHLWDVEGRADDPDVSKTFAVPIVVYKFGSLFEQKGWYVRAPDDLWSYDWEEDEFDQIAAGAFMGRVFSIGEQPINAFAGGWYNPVGSDIGATPDYAFKLSLSFLFPAE